MHNRLATALLLASASPLVAQGAPAGTATFQMTIHLPDSLKTPIPLAGDMSFQMIMMTDGHRVAMEILPSTSQPLMAGMHLKATFTIGADTLHVGILLPAETAAAAGGGSGMRVDVPVSLLGAGNPLLGKMMDSVTRTMTDSLGKFLPAYRRLGTTATVAGITCEEWETVVLSDTTRTCVIATPPAVLALLERFKTMTGFATMLARIPGMADLQKQAYGGKQVIPIRTVNTKLGMRLELTSFTAGAPDAAVFELPADLQVMPLPTMPAKPAGGGQQQ